MKRQRKHFLGILGLFVVTAMTTYAYSLPSEDTNATGGGAVTISVTVVNPNPQVAVIYPHNEDTVGKNLLDLIIEFVAGKRTVITLTNLDTDESTPFNFEPEQTDIVKDFSLNLDNYGGEGNYHVEVKAYDDNDELYSEDGVSFNYTLEPEPVDPVDPTPEPEEEIVTPNTGFFSAKLGFAHADYIIASIVSAVAVFIIFMIVKKNRNKEDDKKKAKR